MGGTSDTDGFHSNQGGGGGREFSDLVAQVPGISPTSLALREVVYMGPQWIEDDYLLPRWTDWILFMPCWMQLMMRVRRFDVADVFGLLVPAPDDAGCGFASGLSISLLVKVEQPSTSCLARSGTPR